MEWLGETVIPSDIDGAERQIVADQPVVIFRPKRQQKGMTFVITAANIPLSKYVSIINALTSSDRVVVGFFVNALKPLLGNHRAKAEKIHDIFLELKDEFRVLQYDIIGHSIGGKISLLTAALYDRDNYIRNIIALDPVDQSPVEFTRHHNTSTTPQDRGGENNTKRKRGRTNLSLTKSKADITLTFTDTGYFIDKKHNAREIQANNPNVKLVLHRSSCHMYIVMKGG